jgi:hypothetical protein
MATFREEKMAARLDLHEALAEPVIYFATRQAARRVVPVRLHLQVGAQGELRNRGFADWSVPTPQIAFVPSSTPNPVVPANGAYVVTKYNGVCKIDTTEPFDGLRQMANVTVLDYPSAKQLGWDPTKPWCGEKPPTET